VDYSRLTALLIEAVKQQQKQITQQQNLIRKQQRLAATQQAQMKTQEARVDEQQNQIRSQNRLSELQQAQIAHLLSQIQAIAASRKTNGRTPDTEIRTVKVRVPMVEQ
jgi:hypothetical protein